MNFDSNLSLGYRIETSKIRSTYILFYFYDGGYIMINYRIRQLRYNRGLLAQEVAEKLGISSSRFNAITTGFETTEQMRVRIAEFFDKPVYWLFGPDAYKKQ